MAVICNREDCLSVWDVLARWQHISIEEFAELINSRKLQAYRVLHPHDWSLDARTLTLQSIEERLAFRGDDHYVITLHDEQGRMIDASADGCVLDENGEPMYGDQVYFLIDDVARVEEGRFVTEPLKAPRAPAEPARRVGRMLRAADAAAKCGISESEWWRWVSEGRMPQGIKVKPKLTVWPEAELEDALAAMVAKARQ